MVPKRLPLLRRLSAQFMEAFDADRQALASQPHLAMVHNNLANALQAQGELQQSINHYRQALDVEPGLAVAQTNLDRALWGGGRPDEQVQ